MAASKLGDAFRYVALMWAAAHAAGALGIMAVRLVDSLPALIFGLHGGRVADRVDRKRTMVGADLLRGLALAAVAAAGVLGHLPLWALLAGALALTMGTSYFEPAYHAALPSLVGRGSVQEANGLVRATGDTILVAGWAATAALLLFLPISSLFALNAVLFFASALLLAGLPGRARRARQTAQTRREAAAMPSRGLRSWLPSLGDQPELAVAVWTLGAGMALSSGTWIVGAPQLVQEELGGGAGAFSLLMTAVAVGSIATGGALSRWPVKDKARWCPLVWLLYLPAYLAFAFAGGLPLALAGALLIGLAQGAAVVLVYSAAQERVPDARLGRVMGLIGVLHRGGAATGLLLVAPLFLLVPLRAIFVVSALVVPVVGVVGLALGASARRSRHGQRQPRDAAEPQRPGDVRRLSSSR
jgi:MFS family permease